ncbi:amidohydrolase/deacetylase family metallohydrolase [Shouchella patagoniensis]|uniref:amidohydrolase/deacetylase family metallohydrolase n=1 Tax=Shouchella patagoniensis TaxID=228576 RepID=UPI00099556D0|nr:amidohydrolase/deacetylase family metallohydrolase [Shouchella patagoniensis]
MKQIFKHIKLANGKRRDVVVEAGLIQEVSEQYDGSADVIELPDDAYLSPGWIDLHTHAFPKYPPYGAEADDIGWKTGVTTVVDAGTCGADDIQEFYEFAERCKTRVLSFLNISRVGLSRTDELSDLTNLSLDAAEAAMTMYPAFIVGIKARMSGSVVGESGIEPLKLAKKLQDRVKKPLMVHIGSAPPQVEDILHLLSAGDIVTHCYNGKENNVFNQTGTPLPALTKAIDRGVLLDIGHGTESFSFKAAEYGQTSGVVFDTISTDIYNGNKEGGPVYSMATTLTKLLALGSSLESCIQAVTEKPAVAIGRADLGQLRPGAKAEFTVFRQVDESSELIDSYGNKRYSKTTIKPIGVYIGGLYHEL